ncbi:uncharacterized protein LOC118185980 [Stegodyphus dumicola]|uniref:uncharacterized protein LOC118185980 n=1 Tax=Stegodyphus dumicola TaxID=202533 RepID=UPI0015AEC2F2|nr:uncharacterized protein LOC118185980 [Stegodyphus dumicola]
MHLLLFLAEEDKIRDAECIDSLVCAELPDATRHPELHNIVKSSMIHGPCGELNRNSPCMSDGVCSKGFPKPFQAETKENVNGYPLYRRRDDGNFIVIKGHAIDNRWVVPYNPYLSKKYINNGPAKMTYIGKMQESSWKTLQPVMFRSS